MEQDNPVQTALIGVTFQSVELKEFPYSKAAGETENALSDICSPIQTSRLYLTV